MDEQIITDVRAWSFDFSGEFKSTDAITANSVAVTPSGPVEVSASSYTVGQIRYVLLNVASCTAGLIYTVGCQGTGTSGVKVTKYRTIRVVAEPAGITAIPATGNVSGRYSVVLAQSGTSAPTVTATLQNSLSGTPTLSRLSEGVFRATLTGAFLENKVTGTTGIFPLLVGNESKVSPPRRISDNVVEFRVYDFGDNLVDGFGEVHLALEVYA